MGQLHYPQTTIRIINDIRLDAAKIEQRSTDKHVATLALGLEQLCIQLMYMIDELAETGLSHNLSKILSITSTLVEDDEGVRSNYPTEAVTPALTGERYRTHSPVDSDAGVEAEA